MSRVQVNQMNGFGYAMRSNTNTDSAGGECQDHDSDVYKGATRKESANESQPAKLCDQDEPLLPGPIEIEANMYKQ